MSYWNDDDRTFEEREADYNDHIDRKIGEGKIDRSEEKAAALVKQALVGFGHMMMQKTPAEREAIAKALRGDHA